MMRKLILLMHTSLDGFAAGPKGEMDWIKLSPALFDFVGELVNSADTALYGRVTYSMMESYWPTAGSKPDASKHDKEHSAWYMKVSKYVISRSLKEKGLHNATIISDNLLENINKIKMQPGKSILMLGSPSASHTLMEQGLIDDYWLFVNPILLGRGTPVFKGINQMINLKMVENKTFANGVVALHYSKN